MHFLETNSKLSENNRQKIKTHEKCLFFGSKTKLSNRGRFGSKMYLVKFKDVPKIRDITCTCISIKCTDRDDAKL